MSDLITRARELAHHLEKDGGKPGAATLITDLLAAIEQQHRALQAARPTVANAVAEPGLDPWLRETRQQILSEVDDALHLDPAFNPFQHMTQAEAGAEARRRIEGEEEE